MALSARNRNKSIKAAQKLVPQANIVGYAIGRSGMQPAIVVGAMLAMFLVVSIALFAATGTFVLPGVLPTLILQHFISPPRGIVVAQQGVILTHRSVWTGRPAKVGALMAHGYVQPTEQSLGRVKVMVGAEPVWLTKGEEAILRQSIQPAMQAHQAQQAPSPYTQPFQ